MATSSLPEKRRLKNTPMYTNRIESSSQKTFHRLIWKVGRFKNLKEGTHYKYDIPLLSCCLSLYKDKQTLYVKALPEGYNKKITCSILYTNLFPIRIQETGRFEYQIPLVVIQNPMNTFYEQGTLCILFIFDKRVETVPGILPFISAKCDKEILMLINEINVSNLGNSVGLVNVLLPFKGGYSVIDKNMLVARSKFFCNYFKQSPNSKGYRLNTTGEIMKRLENYIMCGFTEEPKELEELIDLFTFAVFLKIPSLNSQCETALREYINRDNVHQIRKVGVKNGNESLVRAADAFLAEDCNLKDKSRKHFIETLLGKKPASVTALQVLEHYCCNYTDVQSFHLVNQLETFL